ncbi:zinc ribbon domain-containing protein [Acholeplasma laidlawii]|uniref:zinc ribbon domain-containing protein n=1 Tax=Acholeplasma laidlawii TaxID=2148 RepID=UPI0021F72E15|nr:zinc ribbon domain-containing protein [Acholeplasma laidlawii]
MYCSKCGENLSPDAKFCSSCGNQVGASNQTESASKRKIIFDGKIHKCPSCGSTLNSFEHKCGVCGYELRGSDNANAIQDFALKLEKTKSVEKKNELISNFYIPNTKEDIYEFFILAISSITTDDRCEQAWKAKLEQTYHKAKLSFGNSAEFEYVDKLYSKTMKQYRKKSLNRFMRKGWKYILGGLLIILGLSFMIFGFFRGSESGDEDSPYYMVSLIGMIIAMGAIIMLITDADKKKQAKGKNKVEIEHEEDEE